MSTHLRRHRAIWLPIAVLLCSTLPIGAGQVLGQQKPTGKPKPELKTPKPAATGPADFGVPSLAPGVARIELKGQALVLSNGVLTMTFNLAQGVFKPALLQNLLTERRVWGPREAFSLRLADGRTVSASRLRATGTPRIVTLAADPKSGRLSDRSAGKEAVVAFDDPEGRFGVVWRGVLRDGSNYVRQVVTVSAVRGDLAVSDLVLLDVDLSGATVSGPVPGSPVIATDVFAGMEHPLAVCQAEGGQVRCTLPRSAPVRAGRSATYSSVLGVVPAGQMRRGFLTYIERERARASRPFLQCTVAHDSDRRSRYDEAAALGVIDRVGTELTRTRGTTIDAFLLDDGWDDPNSPWQVNRGFPRGLSGVAAAARRFGAGAGVWISPAGGEGGPREDRIRSGAAQGFEHGPRGLALSGPVYSDRVRSLALDLIRRSAVGLVRLDGLEGGTGPAERSEFDSDADAGMALVGELRAAGSSPFVELAADSWLSPFWLLCADSSWPGGADLGFAGVGPDRQQWITYRDARIYERVVKAQALGPTSAIRGGGLVYARRAARLDQDPGAAFVAEVRSLFGSGAQSQVLDLSPDLLTGPDWDAIAEAATWARRRAAVLRDSHWIGGDPGQLQAYGWASWSPDLGIIVLRNPTDRPDRFELDVQRAFDLPDGVPRRFVAGSPWKEDRGRAAIELVGGRSYRIDLAPFRVLVLEATPAGAPAR